MKALVKHAPGEGNVDILDAPEPSCGENQVRVEIAFCGICGTDIHVLHDTFHNFPPVILGHEFAGTVVEIGRNVSGVRIGERIAGLGASAVACGQCQYCLGGNFIFCAHRRGMGHGANGALTRYVILRPDQLYRVPEHLSMEEAAMSEPFAAAIQAVTEVTNTRIGDVVLVSGPGPIGLLCLKLLVAEGIKTIVAGAAGDDLRLEAARRIGAADVVCDVQRVFATVGCQCKIAFRAHRRPGLEVGLNLEHCRHRVQTNIAGQRPTAVGSEALEIEIDVFVHVARLASLLIFQGDLTVFDGEVVAIGPDGRIYAIGGGKI